MGKRTNQRKEEDRYELGQGLILHEMRMPQADSIWNCFFKGFMEFFVAYGSLAGFLSAFQVQYNQAIVAIAMLLTALFFSALYHFNKIYKKDITYILFFTVFVFLVYRYRTYINSGFYSVVNDVIKFIRNYLNQPEGTQYMESIANRYLAITITAIFVGMVQIIVINIWVSTFMSIFWSILFTLPFYLLPIFFEQPPHLFYQLLLLTGYFSIYIFRNNGHYHRQRSDGLFVSYHRRKKDVISYTQDKIIYLQIIFMVAGGLLLAMFLMNTLYPEKHSRFLQSKNFYKEQLMDMVDTFSMDGFSGLMNAYAAVGGMSGGKLGGIASVSADYQPDLEIEYTPYSTAPVYLKGFTGGSYLGDCWEPVKDADKTYSYFAVSDSSDVEKEMEEMPSVSLTKKERQIQNFQEEYWLPEQKYYKRRYEKNAKTQGKGKMNIKNLGADPAYYYVPYYGEAEKQDMVYDRLGSAVQFPYGETLAYSYFPASLQKTNDRVERNLLPQMYEEVPENCRDAVRAVCKKENFSGTNQQIMNQIQQYFQDNYSYTLRPGKTPDGEDFISYFLDKKKKGFCVHFASSATMILRELGIPARYVEGYAFSYEEMLTDGELLDNEKYEEYYKGKSELGKTGVVDLKITDRDAHAWVEVYDEKLGWQVFDPTPASDESEDDDFWAAMKNRDRQEDGKNVTSTVTIDYSKFEFVTYIVGLGLLAFLLIGFGRPCFSFCKMIAGFHQKDEQENVIHYYAFLCRKLRKKYPEFAKLTCHRQQLSWIKAHFSLEMDVEQWTKLLEEITYGPKRKDGMDYKAIRKAMKKWHISWL